MPKYLNTLTHVPDEEVEAITEDFESEGATVSKRRAEDGTWSITGTFDSDAFSRIEAEEG